MTKDHPSPDDLRSLPESGSGVASRAEQVHRHLLESCAECSAEWDKLGVLSQDTFRSLGLRVAPRPERRVVALRDLSATPEVVEALEQQAAELRKIRRRCRQQLSELRTAPRERRADMVLGASTRFRHRYLAHLLIEESQEVVRENPDEALSFASLVPLVLRWILDSGDRPWAAELRARAEAHRANALRVQGELPRAEAAFEGLRQYLKLGRVPDGPAWAEIASLEASLRIGQRRFEDAARLLRRAALGYESVGDAEGLIRTRIKQANLLRTQGRIAAQLHRLEQAAADLTADSAPVLAIAIAAGRINALCDLERALEARQVLARSLDVFEREDSRFFAAVLRGLEGRIALGLGELEVAEERCRECIDGLLESGRRYDATLAALDLAETYLRRRRTDELYVLAAKLVEEFRRREVDREAAQALRLFARATANRALTVSVLRRLRLSLLP